MLGENFIYTHLACAFHAHFAPPVVACSVYNQWLDYNCTRLHWNFHPFSLNYENKFMELRLWMRTNYQYNRTGTLWEGRYKATVMDSEQYLLTCSRYIELNPVRADMVEHPAEYPWSSYHFNALGIKNSLIKEHSIYTALGTDAARRQSAYSALFEYQVPDRTIEEIRAATNKAWVLGNERFLQQIEDLSQRQAQPKPRGGDKRSKKAKTNRV